MQKVVFVADQNTDEINRLLHDGWKVINVCAVPGDLNSMRNRCFAYFVLEKED